MIRSRPWTCFSHHRWHCIVCMVYSRGFVVSLLISVDELCVQLHNNIVCLKNRTTLITMIWNRFYVLAYLCYDRSFMFVLNFNKVFCWSTQHRSLNIAATAGRLLACMSLPSQWLFIRFLCHRVYARTDTNDLFSTSDFRLFTRTPATPYSMCVCVWYACSQWRTCCGAHVVHRWRRRFKEMRRHGAHY